MVKYGLVHKLTNKLMTVFASSNNEAEFCVDPSYELSVGDDILWLVDEEKQAEYVRNTNTKWYNAGYSTPINRYNSKDLMVVKIEINFVLRTYSDGG